MTTVTPSSRPDFVILIANVWDQRWRGCVQLIELIATSARFSKGLSTSTFGESDRRFSSMELRAGGLWVQTLRGGARRDEFDLTAPRAYRRSCPGAMRALSRAPCRWRHIGRCAISERVLAFQDRIQHLLADERPSLFPVSVDGRQHGVFPKPIKHLRPGRWSFPI